MKGEPFKPRYTPTTEEFHMVHKTAATLKDFIRNSDNISPEDGELLQEAVDAVAGAILAAHSREAPLDRLPWLVLGPRGHQSRHPNEALARLEAEKVGGSVHKVSVINDLLRLL